MFNWLMQNIATILISIALMAVTALIIARLVRQKKQGKSCCGCNCANCAMRGSCYSQQTETR